MASTLPGSAGMRWQVVGMHSKIYWMESPVCDETAVKSSASVSPHDGLGLKVYADRPDGLSRRVIELASCNNLGIEIFLTSYASRAMIPFDEVDRVSCSST